jgi:hypothetical protein
MNLKSTAAKAETFIESVQSVNATDQELSKNALRYYVTVKFLADCPNEDLIEYDILSKFKNEWPGASPERKRETIEKSKREGKIGWNLGVSELICHNAPYLSEPKPAEEKRGELQYAHIRTGHLHAVRFGPPNANMLKLCSIALPLSARIYLSRWMTSKLQLYLTNYEPYLKKHENPTRNLERPKTSRM